MRKILVNKQLNSTNNKRFVKVDVIQEALNILFENSIDNKNFYNMADILH